LVRVPLAFVVFIATALVPVFAPPIEEKKYILGWEIVENTTRTSLAHAHWARVLQLVVSWIFDLNSRFPAYAIEPYFGKYDASTIFLLLLSTFFSIAYSQNDYNEAEWEFVYPGDATGRLGTNNPWNDQVRKPSAADDDVLTVQGEDYELYVNDWQAFSELKDIAVNRDLMRRGCIADLKQIY
jgi:hypothetical protein